jgi:hypothetical protein
MEIILSGGSYDGKVIGDVKSKFIEIPIAPGTNGFRVARYERTREIKDGRIVYKSAKDLSLSPLPLEPLEEENNFFKGVVNALGFTAVLACIVYAAYITFERIWS